MSKTHTEEQIFNGPTQFNMLPKEFVETFTSGDTTPSVKNIRVWKCNTGVVTITDFDNGAEGQVIWLLGHANTTITHGTNIMTNTGANKTLAANRIYSFVHIDGVWYEH